MEEEFKEQAQAAKDSLKRDFRRIALQIALSMQPTNYNTQTGLQNNNKSISGLLADAETIYNWLIKDL